MVAMFEKNFRMPSTFNAFLELSQIQQAIAIKTGVEYWRTLRPYCMGTLFWQLNDDWPCVSWSSIDYYGEWKLLQYHAKRFYAPVISTIIPQENGSAKLYTVNDRKTERSVKIKVVIYDLDGNEQKTFAFNAVMNPGESRCITEFSAALKDEEKPVFAEIITEAVSEEIHRNTYFPLKYKNLPLRNGNVQASVLQEGNSFIIELSTDYPIFFLILRAVGIEGLFSDNSFTLIPGEKRVVRFNAWESCSLDKFESKLQITHLKEVMR